MLGQSENIAAEARKRGGSAETDSKRTLRMSNFRSCHASFLRTTKPKSARHILTAQVRC